MQLLEIDSSQFDLVADWLSEEQNYQWLQFASRGQSLSAVSLRLMAQRDLHCLRLFTSDDGEAPIGIVALSDISPLTKTASLWYVLGDKSFQGRGFTSRAVGAMLDHAFGQLEIQACQAWAVPDNRGSVRVLEKNGFQMVGRQRSCHCLDGRLVDRLLFDLLATEHKETQCLTTQR